MEDGNNNDNDKQPEKPEVLLAVWHQGGTLWLTIKKARNLNVNSGKVYAKSYFLPDSGNTKQKTEYCDNQKNPEFDATITVSGTIY